MVGIPRAFQARASAPFGSSSTGRPPISRSSNQAFTTGAPPRSEDSGSTAMSSGASVFDSAASEGISATQGAHQVAHMLTTMPRPRNSDSRCSFPAASRNGTSGTGSGGSSITSPFSPEAACACLRAASPAARVPPAARTPLRVINAMLEPPP